MCKYKWGEVDTPKPTGEFMWKFRNLCCLFVAGFGAIGSAAGGQDDWYLGAFEGEWGESNQVMVFKVDCKSPSTCELTMWQKSSQRQLAHQTVSGQVVRTGNHIENNNLDTTRDAVKREPNLYNDPRFGPLLRPLRHILESGSRFSNCVDISKERIGGFVFCQVEVGQSFTPVLLFTTMNATCNDLPFCAYYYVPLARTNPTQSKDAP